MFHDRFFLVFSMTLKPKGSALVFPVTSRADVLTGLHAGLSLLAPTASGSF